MRLLALLLCLLLAACASGPPVRVYPPQARVHELQQMPDGSLNLQLRVQNFSTIAMRFSRLELQLKLADAAAVSIDVDPALSVGPGSADIYAYRVPASAAATAAVRDALAGNRALRYRVEGRIESSEPRDGFDVEYESSLHPVPGLSGVMR